MSSVYMERVQGVKNPRVGIVSNGEEEIKGSELVRETFPLLQNSGLNFIGNVEGKDIPFGVADVVVTDGFTGNVIIKTLEGVAKMITTILRQELTSLRHQSCLPRASDAISGAWRLASTTRSMAARSSWA